LVSCTSSDAWRVDRSGGPSEFPFETSVATLASSAEGGKGSPGAEFGAQSSGELGTNSKSGSCNCESSTTSSRNATICDSESFSDRGGEGTGLDACVGVIAERGACSGPSLGETRRSPAARFRFGGPNFALGVGTHTSISSSGGWGGSVIRRPSFLLLARECTCVVDWSLRLLLVARSTVVVVSFFLGGGAESSSALSGEPEGVRCLRLRVERTGGSGVPVALRSLDGRFRATEADGDVEIGAETSDDCFFAMLHGI
jgi:hypothetical protein